VNRRVFIQLLLLSPLAAAATDGVSDTLRVGLFPNLTPVTLITAYQPVRLYLEKAMSRPVTVLTAPDFRTFVERTQSGAYDIVLTAPHLARLAELEGGYEPVAIYGSRLQALILIARNSPITKLEDLRGKKVAMPDPLALVNMLGGEMLRKAGVAETEYVWVNAHSHNGAALAVLREDAQAAVIGSVPYAQLAEGIRKDLRLLASSKTITNQCWLVSKRIDADQRLSIQDALLRFSDTPAGRRFLDSRGCGEIRKILPDELKSLDVYAREVKRRLDTGG
jgi:phosphonate transport system substrate-binding protein